jgi:hypothetical protein
MLTVLPCHLFAKSPKRSPQYARQGQSPPVCLSRERNTEYQLFSGLVCVDRTIIPVTSGTRRNVVTTSVLNKTIQVIGWSVLPAHVVTAHTGRTVRDEHARHCSSFQTVTFLLQEKYSTWLPYVSCKNGNPAVYVLFEKDAFLNRNTNTTHTVELC